MASESIFWKFLFPDMDFNNPHEVFQKSIVIFEINWLNWKKLQKSSIIFVVTAKLFQAPQFD